MIEILPFIVGQLVVSFNPDRWTRVNRQSLRFWGVYLHLGELLSNRSLGDGKPHIPNGVVSF